MNIIFQRLFPFCFLSLNDVIADRFINICDELPTNIVESAKLCKVICKVPYTIFRSCRRSNNGNIRTSVNSNAITGTFYFITVNCLLVKNTTTTTKL